MKNKVLIIIAALLFVIVLILLNVFLNSQNNLETNLEESKEEESTMEILKVTSANFEEEVLNSDKTVLIDFYADWCGPCKMLSPIIENVANENEDIKVVKIDVDNAQDLAIKYQIYSIPTIVVIKNGEETDRSVGIASKSQILEMVK